MIVDMFGALDNALEQSLNHRLAEQNIISSNLVNASTPGYRALGYSFEEQLQNAFDTSEKMPLRVSHKAHQKQVGVSGDNKIQGDMFIKPTESIGNDGNTVDVDQEMAELAANQILYKASVEILNRRLGLLKYGINGGR